jgi:galactitol-specific phosphotransferase system IIB component
MPSIEGSEVRRIVVACEAGMGSSVMLTSSLNQRFAALDVTVRHLPFNRLTDGDADVVVCHRGLAKRAAQSAPETVIVVFDLFLGDPFRVEDGHVQVTDTPGWGVEINPDWLERATHLETAIDSFRPSAYGALYHKAGQA